ncbi:phosphopyruvate hydratase [Phycisphaerales bacterium AB-hyl4]|uniref:Enolase n=1 Tax=Natronomicrosphaera hydrolytica TaxID=3242702 RepID=A0ABV4U529_9BACT
MQIATVDAWQIFDSRGNPTVEAEVTLHNGVRGRGLVPSGASTGQFEALELRDGDAQRYRGKSVFKAIANIRDVIGPAVRGMDVSEQRAIDERMIELDGTAEKSRLGANAILGVSMAVANAAANARQVPLYASLGDGTRLPLPMIQIIGGGSHAAWRTDVQDYLVMAIGATSYEQTLEMTFNVYHAAGELLKERGVLAGVADEGGFWPEFATNAEALDTLVEVIQRAGYRPGEDLGIALDIAASDLFDEQAGCYRFRLEDRQFSCEAFADLMIDWCERYPIVSIEDPAADVDEAGWRRVCERVGEHVQVIGDDLFTTNRQRIERGIEQKLANSVLIKLNQIGTVTETIDAIRLTQQAGWRPVVSARSGETEDAFISHLAVATDAGQLKVGSFARSERMAKWNEVLRIARELGERKTFASGGLLGFQPTTAGRRDA